MGNREKRRLAMLHSFGLGPGQREPSLDALAEMAASTAEVPVGLVSLVDTDHLLIAGTFGFEESVVDRNDSFCTHALIEPNRTFWITDASSDPRFHDSRYVVGAPHVRFYAGVPLSVNEEIVGTLSVLGPQPRDTDDRLLGLLELLGRACETVLSQRHRSSALRQALTASADALIDCDPKGCITAWSDGATRLFGYTADEALGADVTLIIPESYRVAHQEGMGRWRESGAARLGRRLELPSVRKDGSELDIELWMSITQDQGLTRVHANIRDISERRSHALELARAEDEARELQSQLHHVWRINALGEMAASLAHELNQPLTAATTYLYAAKSAIGRSDLVDISAQDPLEKAAAQLLRAGSIIRHMREFLVDDARGLGSERVSVMLADLNGMLTLLGKDKNVAIEMAVEDENDAVLADRVQIQQVILNLARNGAEATDGGLGARVRITGRARSATTYEIVVDDSGSGMSPEELERSFRSVSSGKASGMGLGLNITRKIIESHGGTLSVERSSLGGAALAFNLIRDVAVPAQSRPTLRTGLINDASGLKSLLSRRFEN